MIPFQDNLKELNISHNSLTEIPFIHRFFYKMPLLRIADMTDNYWTCTERININELQVSEKIQIEDIPKECFIENLSGLNGDIFFSKQWNVTNYLESINNKIDLVINQCVTEKFNERMNNLEYRVEKMVSNTLIEKIEQLKQSSNIPLMYRRSGLEDS